MVHSSVPPTTKAILKLPPSPLLQKHEQQQLLQQEHQWQTQVQMQTQQHQQQQQQQQQLQQQQQQMSACAVLGSSLGGSRPTQKALDDLDARIVALLGTRP